jgi:hypothetical protein
VAPATSLENLPSAPAERLAALERLLKAKLAAESTESMHGRAVEVLRALERARFAGQALEPSMEGELWAILQCREAS